MRAIALREFGGPGVLEPAEVERPQPIPTEVLVHVHAAGINPVDWKTRAGRSMTAALGEPPVILGWDVAGVVEATGRGVARFRPGDRVFGMPWFPRQAGAYAEFVTAPSRHFAPTPPQLDDVHAAGLPLAGLTAWQSLVDVAGVGSGDRVLVHAAAGGVGHLAVQIAKARGAHVIGTARPEKHPFLRELGVDEPIDYTERPFEEVVSDLDVVLDGVGTEDYGLRSLATLREGGLLIVLPGGLGEAVSAAAKGQGKRATGILVEPDGAGLEGLASLVEAGSLRVEVAETMDLEQAAHAHELGETGHTRGKLVLTVKPP